jgi:hypothetical protein
MTCPLSGGEDVSMRGRVEIYPRAAVERAVRYDAGGSGMKSMAMTG